jgi:hypothetical protein
MKVLKLPIKGVIIDAFLQITASQMRYLNRNVILKYLYDQLTGNFMGFMIGLSATGLVSQFFETRSIRNFWGLASKKTVVDKETFANLEWIISIIIGFIVFEIMTKVVKTKIDQYFPLLKRRVLRWAIINDVPEKLEGLNLELRNKRATLFSTVHGTVKNTFAKYSKR